MHFSQSKKENLQFTTRINQLHYSSEEKHWCTSSEINSCVNQFVWYFIQVATQLSYYVTVHTYKFFLQLYNYHVHNGLSAFTLNTPTRIGFGWLVYSPTEPIMMVISFGSNWLTNIHYLQLATVQWSTPMFVVCDWPRKAFFTQMLHM